MEPHYAWSWTLVCLIRCVLFHVHLWFRKVSGAPQAHLRRTSGAPQARQPADQSRLRRASPLINGEAVGHRQVGVGGHQGGVGRPPPVGVFPHRPQIAVPRAFVFFRYVCYVDVSNCNMLLIFKGVMAVMIRSHILDRSKCRRIANTHLRARFCHSCQTTSYLCKVAEEKTCANPECFCFPWVTMAGRSWSGPQSFEKLGDLSRSL